MLSWVGSRCCTRIKAMPGPARQRVHELPARLETARRRPYADNRKIPRAVGVAAPRRARPARSRRIRFGPMRAVCWHPANFPKSASLRESPTDVITFLPQRAFNRRASRARPEKSGGDGGPPAATERGLSSFRFYSKPPASATPCERSRLRQPLRVIRIVRTLACEPREKSDAVK